MKFPNSLLLLAAIAISFLSSCARVGPGYVGIKVNQAGSDRGVESYPLQTGWVWYNPISEDVYEFPTFIQTHTYTDASAIQFQSSEGTVLKAPVTISYAIQQGSVPKLFVRFRRSADELTTGYIQQQIRNAFTEAANGYKTIELFTRQGEFIGKVQKHLVEKLGSDITIDTISLAGAIDAPDSIKSALDNVIQAQQRAAQAEAKVAQAEAEGRQKVAQAEADAKSITAVAEAQAAANRKLADSLTPTLVELKKIEKWNGALPHVSGGATPFISLSK